MSGMLMWDLGSPVGVPMTTEEANRTLEPIRKDGELAEATHAPDWNELDTDEGSTPGLAPRAVAGDTTDSEQYAPWWAAAASYNHNEIVDNQVASSGTAAAREVAGEQGHGTMQYAESMEPVIRDGAAFGNDYMLANPAVIQEGAGNYMTPVTDRWASAVAQNRATQDSRAAFQDSQYAAFLGGK